MNYIVSKVDYSLALRIPSWAKQYSLYKNNQEITDCIIENGYAIIKDEFKDGDKIKINFDMKIRLIESNPKLRENSGKLAIMREPIVYCVESADNGENLWAIHMNKNSKFNAEYDNELLGGTGTNVTKTRPPCRCVWQSSAVIKQRSNLLYSDIFRLIYSL